MTQLLRDFVERVQGVVATHRAAGRRGGPLLDFISANFLYILTTVAVVGVAGGAYATYERGSYSRDLRAIVSAIVAYGTHGKLRNMTVDDLAVALPSGIDVDTANGVTYFGGILGEGLPLRVYGGKAAHAKLGAGSNRQLVLVIGDSSLPANESSGICVDLARTLGPGVRGVQLFTAQAPAAASAISTTTSALSATEVPDATFKKDPGTVPDPPTSAAGLTFTRTARTSPVTTALSEIHEDDRVVALCGNANDALQIIMVLG